MHAILFQLALIPFTMSRYSVAALSATEVNKYVPLNRIVRIHIYLGYTMGTILCASTAFFFLFFGVLCVSGEQDFCDKFTSEIMITGYVILGTFLIILATSYLRYFIPYEVFYAIHHLVFVMYALTIAHTFDNTQRSGERQRSQTFKWFSVTLLYYICDRLAMHFHHTYRTKLLECSAVRGGRHGGNPDTQQGGDCSKMLILKLKRPPLFFFRPGQYAFLKVSSIDNMHWHPFSIASGPNSPYLEFYVEIFGKGSWTDKLWNLLESGAEIPHDIMNKNSKGCTVEFQVMGPCGTGLATTQDFSHAVAIGTGTGKWSLKRKSICPLRLFRTGSKSSFHCANAGVVPLLSLFKQHVRQLLRLAPDAYSRDLKELQARVELVESAEEVSHKGSMVRQIVEGCRIGLGCSKPYESLHRRSRTDSLRDSIQTTVMYREENCDSLSARELRRNLKEFKKAAFQTTRSFYGVVLLGIMPVMGVGLIGFTISWNTVNVEIPNGWFEFLQAWTVLFQLIYAIIAIFVWDADHFFAYTDVALCLVAPFADWYWLLQYQRNGVLSPADITTYCLLAVYMTARAWAMTVKPGTSKSWRRTGMEHGGGASSTMERLDVAWVTRSCCLVSKILPDVNVIWEELVASWGLEKAGSVCRFHVYVTDPDERAVRLLKRELSDTAMYKNGMVRFGRPDIGQIIENHSVEMICTRRSSHSLLAYVGSPELAREIHECKLFNDMKVAITGNKKHQMEFVSESYGGVKAKRSAAVPAGDLNNKRDKDVIAALSGESDADEVEEIVGNRMKVFNLSKRRTTSYGSD